MQIVFRPKFCVNCGEKIVRDEWHFWTSGRFCELCEIEFQGREIGWRIACVLAVAGIAAAGFAFVAPERPPDTKLVASTVRAAEPRSLVGRPEAPTRQERNKERPAPSQAPPAGVAIEQKPVLAASEPIYMCGAETKKGTPCTRKVKGNVRCWQHKGMPAILSAKELRVE